MPQSKEVHKDYMKRRREGSQTGSQCQGSQGQGSQIRYDHDLTVREILTLHSQRTQDQIDRFPNIPLPFGEAYYQALSPL